MTFRRLLWALVALVVVHDLEQALLLPAAIAARVPPDQVPFARAMLFAALGWTVALAALVARAAAASPPKSTPVYVAIGAQLLVAVDVLLLDVVASLLERRYSPGLATGVLLELPFTLVLVRAALRDGEIDREGLVKTAVLSAVLFGPLVGMLGGLAYGVVRVLGFSPTP